MSFSYVSPCLLGVLYGNAVTIITSKVSLHSNMYYKEPVVFLCVCVCVPGGGGGSGGVRSC